MKWLADWWRQPDHFDWLSGYLQAHGLGTNTRRLLSGLSASLLMWPVAVVWGPALPHPVLALALAGLAGVIGVSMAALWLVRWPTRRQSIVFAMTGSMTIAAASLWQVRPVVALMACAGLAVTGGYVALFHNARYMAVNLLLAVAVGAVQVVRLVNAGEPMLGIDAYLLVLELNVIVPFAIQIVVRALGVDLLRANRDPLTGLMNRRACNRAIIGRMLTSADHMFLAVAMVDLDRFKALNDSQGHAAGDQALVAAAHALTTVCQDSALAGRIGGEEFLIADVVATEHLTHWGQQLCDAIAASTPRVTASVGTAALAVRYVGSDDADQTLRRLIACADSAMYDAKRCGGNQARHHRRDGDGRVDGDRHLKPQRAERD